MERRRLYGAQGGRTVGSVGGGSERLSEGEVSSGKAIASPNERGCRGAADKRSDSARLGAAIAADARGRAAATREPTGAGGPTDRPTGAKECRRSG